MAKGIKKITRKLLKSDIFSTIIGYVVYLYTLFVGFTTRWKKYHFKEFEELWDKEESIIIIIWHGRATMIPFFWNKKHPLNALVSVHNDGKFMARLLKHYGLKIIGGSSTFQAQKAALELLDTIKNKNETIAIIPDGPIGPSMHMNKSPLFFAQKSGKPIIGITYSVKRAHIFKKSWDNMMFPFPFNKGILNFTKPFYIPKNATEQQIEKYRQEIETALRTISINADVELGRAPVLPGIKTKKKNSLITAQQEKTDAH